VCARFCVVRFSLFFPPFLILAAEDVRAPLVLLVAGAVFAAIFADAIDEAKGDRLPDEPVDEETNSPNDSSHLDNGLLICEAESEQQRDEKHEDQHDAEPEEKIEPVPQIGVVVVLLGLAQNRFEEQLDDEENDRHRKENQQCNAGALGRFKRLFESRHLLVTAAVSDCRQRSDRRDQRDEEIELIDEKRQLLVRPVSDLVPVALSARVRHGMQPHLELEAVGLLRLVANFGHFCPFRAELNEVGVRPK